MKKNYPKIKFNHQYFLKNRLASLLGCCLFLFFSVGQAQTTFNGSGTPIIIPDPGTVNSIANSNLIGIHGVDFVITRVTLNINHGWTSDLIIILQAPDGSTNLTLSSSNGESSPNYTNTQFEDGGADISTEFGPFTGVYQPEGGSFLDAFEGVNVNGNWRLFVVDDDPLFQGTLQNWSITFDPPPTCPFPINVEASPLTTTTASVSWNTEPNATNGYEWVLMGQGVSPNVGTALFTDTTTTTTTSFTGLTPGTTYDFYVRSDCGGSNSSWSVRERFTISLDYCGTTNFYDNGGQLGNYLNGSFETKTISPVLAGEQVTLEFLSFVTDLNEDGILIYDGPNASAPLLSSGFVNSGFEFLPSGAWHGTGAFSADGEIFSSSHPSGSLTIVFISNGLGQAAGWEAEVSCGPPPTCFPPQNPEINNVLAFTADLSWDATIDPPGESQGYEYVLITDSSIPDMNTPITGSVGTGVTSIGLTTLNAGTDYDAYVRTFCTNSPDDKSAWSEVVPFTTDISCFAPTSLSVSNLTAVTADLNWVATNSTISEGYEWVLMAPSDAPDISNSLYNGTTDSSTTIANATGLTDGETYDAYVRAECSPGDFSDWSIKRTFTTPCLPISVLPWSEGFESLTTVGSTIYPDCWTDGVGTISSDDNEFLGIVARTGDNFLTHLFGLPSIVYTRGFNLAASQEYIFSFWHRTSAALSGQSFEVWVGTSPDIGSMVFWVTYILWGLSK
jgi:subtilisin-like proprotein convertase family protein